MTWGWLPVRVGSAADRSRRDCQTFGLPLSQAAVSACEIGNLMALPRIVKVRILAP